MKNRKALIIMLVICLFVFLWFELIPFFVRRNCSKRSLMEGHYETSSMEKAEINFDVKKANAIETDRLNNWYLSCVREFGLPY